MKTVAKTITTEKEKMNRVPFIILAITAIVSLSLSVTACKVVPPGHVGVQSFMGSLKERVLDPGARVNFNRVTRVSLQTQNLELSVTDRDIRAAVSSDMQSVGFAVNLNYYITSPEAARNLVQYVSRDPEQWETIVIEPTIDQAVKSNFATRSLRELIEEREVVRAEIAQAIETLIEERLTERDDSLAGAIRVGQLTLTNLSYSDEFEQVIEQTQREEQRVRLAENELSRIRIETQRQLVEAQAEREASVERSRGVAEAMLIEAQAQAESARLLQEAGYDVNYYRMLDVWNGVMPQVVSDGELMLSVDR